MKLSLKKRAYNATAGWGLQDYAIHQAARAWVAGYRAAKRDARKKRPASSATGSDAAVDKFAEQLYRLTPLCKCGDKSGAQCPIHDDDLPSTAEAK